MKDKLKSLTVKAYCHFAISLLCFNVLFDLALFGIPLFILYKMQILSPSLFLRCTTFLINWTTPIVLAMPMIFSGTKLYCNDIDLLIEAKASESSLLLANHGSRIDWMVGMLVGFARNLGGKTCDCVRVGFVCEATIQFLPIIGWYRNIVARDIFVWRSFLKDAPTIHKNIQDFIVAREKRMLFLSPEGVVVDFGPKDFEYIEACRKFCIEQKHDPFDYVLTPRYKGSLCLLQNVKGPIISVCIAYVRDGKLQNCKLLSPDRVVPDIYTLNEGVGGSPVEVYIHLKRIDIAQDLSDPKAIFLENYKEKDNILKKWDEHLLAGTANSDSWMAQFAPIESNRLEYIFSLSCHTLLMFVIGIVFGKLNELAVAFGILFLLVTSCHTIGSTLNSTSMESVPFETGIKAIVGCLLEARTKKQKCKAD